MSVYSMGSAQQAEASSMRASGHCSEEAGGILTKRQGAHRSIGLLVRPRADRSDDRGGGRAEQWKEQQRPLQSATAGIPVVRLHLAGTDNPQARRLLPWLQRRARQVQRSPQK